MPAPPSAPSNIRAHVRWREGSVYAGEEIECIIAFTNVAPLPGAKETELDSPPPPPPLPPPPHGYPRDQRRPSHVPSTTQSRRSSVVRSTALSNRAPSVASAKDPSQVRGHRPSLSLNVVSATSRGGLQSAPVAVKAPNSAVQGHGKSLSIISLGSDRTSEGRVVSEGRTAKRPARAHGRSASLQMMPSPRPPTSPFKGPAPPRQPSPLFESSTPPALAENQIEPLPVRPTRRRPGTVSGGNTPHLGRQNSLQKQSPATAFNAGFQFPAVQPKVKTPSPKRELARASRSPSRMHSAQPRSFSPRPSDGWSGALSSLNPISRVISESSNTATPRSSSEFQSMSNHSDETQTSELPYQYKQNGSLLAKAPHSRQLSKSNKPNNIGSTESETLMMGYAQTMGYFVLDGSLVNAAPFEEVKRKGVQGSGGVIGIERSKRASGMFGAFSWGNIGESLGGLLGGDETSSMAQMKATVGSKSIPLLSTPQNVLFVDLNLAPGESKSYTYRFSLPRGLPPTHRGRAIKVFYHLTLGVQRPEGQTVKRLEIPFRVLGSYNARGETLGHDLMSPYILLEDAAKSNSIPFDPSTPSALPKFTNREFSQQSKTPKQGLEDFLRYTERLLEQPQDARQALASPTSPNTPKTARKQSIADQPPATVKEAVDLAILRANYIGGQGQQRQSEGQSANRFNIARSGQPVAVLTLLRTAYRLGEAVVGTIDFTAPSLESGLPLQAPTFAVLAEIESAERVDGSLALRSSNSIQRVTRKVHSAVRENSFFARQISFELLIPFNATPTFETTGVSLAWRLRVEFSTQRPSEGLGLDGQMAQAEDCEMLEELGSDERGTTMIAKERLTADTFEIAVPLKVYGAPGIESMVVEQELLEI